MKGYENNSSEVFFCKEYYCIFVENNMQQENEKRLQMLTNAYKRLQIDLR